MKQKLPIGRAMGLKGQYSGAPNLVLYRAALIGLLFLLRFCLNKVLWGSNVVGKKLAS